MVAPFGLPTVFHAKTPEELVSHLEQQVGAKCIEVAPAIEVIAGRYRLQCSELWSSQFSARQSGKVDDDILRVHFGGEGPGWAQVGRQTIELTPRQAVIALGPLTRHMGARSRQISWRIQPSAVSRKLAALTGALPHRNIVFDPRLDLCSTAARTFERTLYCLLEAIPHCCSRSDSLVLMELEQALIVSLLSISRHTFSDVLDRPVSNASSGQMRRVEEYLAAHWNEPFDIERVAQVAGTSTRSLYRAFRHQRGYSPMEFLRQHRLHRARELLQDSTAMTSVKEVAFACGFSDTSHFSREFSRLFAEPPSATLERAHRQRRRA